MNKADKMAQDIITGTNLYFDRQGKPIKSREEFSKLFNDFKYKVVKQDKLPNGLFVSTVWLGINHNFVGPSDSPIIFETMVFDHSKKEDYIDMDRERYSTEKQAIAGHKRMMKKYKSWKPII